MVGTGLGTIWGAKWILRMEPSRISQKTKVAISILPDRRDRLKPEHDITYNFQRLNVRRVLCVSCIS
jgi:hypothetical protein